MEAPGLVGLDNYLNLFGIVSPPGPTTPKTRLCFLLLFPPEAQIVSALQNFAGLGYAAPTIRPVLRALGGFISIRTLRPEPALAALAGAGIALLNACRAPMPPQERARRIAMEKQQGRIQDLDLWGYPIVSSNFDFHMPPTGSRETDRRKKMLRCAPERL
jgi:hypothetical protein